MGKLNLNVFERSVQVECDDDTSFRLIKTCYSAFLSNVDSPDVALSYSVIPTAEQEGWRLKIGADEISCETQADLLYDFEKDMTIRLQKLRSDLYFVHSAALYRDEKCVIVSGASGAGKSTMCWALCNSGFSYLSDELAPVDTSRMQVVPYPHALCLKTRPDSGAPLPPTTVDTDYTLHVPTDSLPQPPVDSPRRLSAIVFIVFDGSRDSVAIQRISAGEAAARLYSNALNQLAHDTDGLPAAREIAGSVPAFTLTTGTIGETASAIENLVRNL